MAKTNSGIEEASLDTMNFITRSTCRVCNSKNLSHVFSLGMLYVNNFINKGEEKNHAKAPLELVLCENCSLLQLKHTAPQELMYARFYWYRSRVTETMRGALKEICETSQKLVSLVDGDVILDIGANDGTLLAFYPSRFVRVGCEPANNLISELTTRCDKVIHDFWTAEAYDKLGLPKAKIVTALGMFYDMEDPNQFVRDVSRVLAEDGVFIAQLMCLKNMIDKNDVGNICHEHLEFYSLESLKYLFEKNGLEIFKVEENSVNGGSYRLYGRLYKNGSIPFTEKFTVRDYLAFFQRVEDNKRKCIDFIRKAVLSGKKVYVYGASTKGNTILQYYGLDNSLIEGAAEKSPEKWGR